MSKKHSDREVVVPDAIFPFIVHANGVLEGKPGYGKTKILPGVVDAHSTVVTNNDRPRVLSPVTEIRKDQQVANVGPVITIEELRHMREDPAVQEWIGNVLANDRYVVKLSDVSGHRSQ